ncbi:CBS domain-containing protein [bacterium]|nr:CBS domain-containing protein [bacterium]MCI0607042.1 CBS domain-containing protein [bacterium]
MKVSQIMKQAVETCVPDDNLSMAAKKMWDFDIGWLPVVDLNKQVIGIITDRDICMAGYTQGRALFEIPVSVAMSKSVFSCASNDTIAAAEEEMRLHQVRRLPVIASDGKVEGVLSINDLAREVERELTGTKQEITTKELTDTLATICEPRASQLQARLQ